MLFGPLRVTLPLMHASFGITTRCVFIIDFGRRARMIYWCKMVEWESRSDELSRPCTKLMTWWGGAPYFVLRKYTKIMESKKWFHIFSLRFFPLFRILFVWFFFSFLFVTDHSMQKHTGRRNPHRIKTRLQRTDKYYHAHVFDFLVQKIKYSRKLSSPNPWAQRST